METHIHQPGLNGITEGFEHCSIPLYVFNNVLNNYSVTKVCAYIFFLGYDQ